MQKRGVIVLVIILWGAVFVTAYNYFAAKISKTQIENDNQRLYNISVYDYHIAKYYIAHNKLPNNLHEIASSENYDESKTVEPVLFDPENKEYTYQAISRDTYKICATFSTDTIANKNTTDEYTDYIAKELKKYAKSVDHKKGYDCIEIAMAGYPESQTNTIADANTQPTEAFVFHTPKNGDRFCLGHPYLLTWQGDKNTNEIGIYLIPPTSMKQPQSWLQNGYAVSPGEIAESSRLEGSLVWSVGALEKYMGKQTQEPVKPGTGYQLGVVTKHGNTEKTYTSDNFEIMDCSSIAKAK